MRLGRMLLKPHFGGNGGDWGGKTWLVGATRRYSSSSSSSSLALMYPGQGSQTVGMGQDILEEFPQVASMYEEIEESLQQNLRKLMFQGPQNELDRTENTQPALYTHALAIQEVLRQELELDLTTKKPCVSSVLGHSVGEFSALGAAGVFESIGQGAKLLRLRGKVMQRAADAELQKCDDTTLAMYALVINPRDRRSETEIVDDITRTCKNHSSDSSVGELASINSPKQMVISGHTRTLMSVLKELEDRKVVYKGMPLAVSAPFHCSIMLPARYALQLALEFDSTSNLWDQVTEYVDETSIEPNGKLLNNSPVPLISNVNAECIFETHEIIRQLVEQVTCPVRWSDCVRKAASFPSDSLVSHFLEVGGKTLKPFVRQSLQKPGSVYSISDIRTLKDFLSGTFRNGDICRTIDMLNKEN